MPLITDVQNRYSTTLLIALTNPDDPDVTTLDTGATGKLQLAADDVAQVFEALTATGYDATEAMHTSVGVEGVVALLRRRTGKYPDAESEWDDFLSALRRVAEVTGRNRVEPTSNSLMQPSEDDRLTSTPRPAFDDRHFDPFLPAPPRGGVTTDSLIDR